MYFVDQQGADLLNEAIALRVTSECGANARQLQCLYEASKNRQVVMIKTENGEAIASISFAKISKHTLRLLADNPEHQLRSYEYSEGKILYVVDAFFRKNNFKRSRALLSSLITRHRIIAYVNKNRLRVIYNDNGYFKIINLSHTELEL